MGSFSVGASLAGATKFAKRWVACRRARGGLQPLLSPDRGETIMAVIPFRPRPKRVIRRRTPDVASLATTYVKTGILLCIAPWMVWLDILGDTDTSPQPEERDYD